MENLRLAAHRQIGFTGASKEDNATDIKSIEKEIKTKFKPPKKPKLVETDLTDSHKIFNWIEEHKKFISINAICKEVGMDTSNFEKIRKKRGEIPTQFIDKIILILEMYGYIK